jgi:hypothetical protein
MVEDGIRAEYNALRLSHDMDGARDALVAKLRRIADAIEARRCDPWAPSDAADDSVID